MMRYFLGGCIALFSLVSIALPLDVYDVARNRHIPVSLLYPESGSHCQATRPCPVAFISAGYGVPYEQYQFIAAKLNAMNYLVVLVNHQLPEDPPLARSGDLYQNRIENWQRGATSLDLVYRSLAAHFINYDFSAITLIGHSNGGDISTWLTKHNAHYVKHLITLDHKRVTVPKHQGLRVLSLRSPEYPTAEGLLLSPDEQAQFGVCVITFPHATHMDFSDYGHKSVKQVSSSLIGDFLGGSNCEQLKLNQPSS